MVIEWCWLMPSDDVIQGFLKNTVAEKERGRGKERGGKLDVMFSNLACMHLYMSNV